ncbi:MAG: protein kinase [Pirellulales bacterium]
MLPIHESTSAASAGERRLAELLEELTRQVQSGQEAALEEILARHPDHADEIRRYLPALRSLAEFDASTLGPAGSTSGLPEGGRGLLGDFRLLREVGRGGMGVVYEAEQLSLGRRVALKVLPFAAMLDERRLQRFKNEAHAAAVLHHPHIVPVYGVGCERGVHYYAMQLIDGCSLAEALAERASESAAPASVGSAVRTDSRLPLPPGEGRGEGR